jgi:homoserine kinase
MGGSLVAGILTGDASLIGKALDSDAIVEPVRGPLIPGFQAVKEAALAAGACGRHACRGGKCCRVGSLHGRCCWP